MATKTKTARVMILKACFMMPARLSLPAFGHPCAFGSTAGKKEEKENGNNHHRIES